MVAINIYTKLKFDPALKDWHGCMVKSA